MTSTSGKNETAADTRMPDVQKLENSPRPTGRDGEQEARKNGSKDSSGSPDRDKR